MLLYFTLPYIVELLYWILSKHTTLTDIWEAVTSWSIALPAIVYSDDSIEEKVLSPRPLSIFIALPCLGTCSRPQCSQIASQRSRVDCYIVIIINIIPSSAMDRRGKAMLIWLVQRCQETRPHESRWCLSELYLSKTTVVIIIIIIIRERSCLTQSPR